MRRSSGYSGRPRRERTIQRICWLLLVAFFVTSVPPVWALPEPPVSAAPLVPASGSEPLPLDPLVSEILRRNGQSLQLPTGLPAGAGPLYPQQLAALPEASPEHHATWLGTPSASPCADPEPTPTPTPGPVTSPAGPQDPPAWMTEPSPAPAQSSPPRFARVAPAATRFPRKSS